MSYLWIYAIICISVWLTAPAYLIVFKKEEVETEDMIGIAFAGIIWPLPIVCGLMVAIWAVLHPIILKAMFYIKEQLDKYKEQA